MLGAPLFPRDAACVGWRGGPCPIGDFLWSPGARCGTVDSEELTPVGEAAERNSEPNAGGRHSVWTQHTVSALANVGCEQSRVALTESVFDDAIFHPRLAGLDTVRKGVEQLVSDAGVGLLAEGCIVEGLHPAVRAVALVVASAGEPHDLVGETFVGDFVGTEAAWTGANHDSNSSQPRGFVPE